jgi:alkylation response protein AidB-like acyl-CoA dehydrogenase
MDRVATPDYVARLDREKAYPHELFDAWIEAGLLGLPYPEDLGGAGGSVLDLALVSEEIGKTSADLVMAYAGGLFCGMTVARKGSEEQKQKWIPAQIDGRIKFSIGISEPDAGSDVGAIRTVARKDGSDWVLNGHKVWQSGAGAKDNVICLYARTDMDAHYRQGMSLFLVDNNRPGVSMKKLDMLGRYCMGTYEVTLDNVRVPEDQLIGGVNKGWDCLLSGLQTERITVAACDVGSAQGAVDLALAYAKERKQFGRPIGNFQSIAHMLADMQTEVEAARSLMYRAAWMVDAGKNAMNEINMAKLFASEVYVRVANLGMQIYGGNGYSMEYPMQRHYRDSRIATVVAGTSQIMRNMIAGGMGLKPQ